MVTGSAGLAADVAVGIASLGDAGVTLLQAATVPISAALMIMVKTLFISIFSSLREPPVTHDHESPDVSRATHYSTQAFDQSLKDRVR